MRSRFATLPVGAYFVLRDLATGWAIVIDRDDLPAERFKPMPVERPGGAVVGVMELQSWPGSERARVRFFVPGWSVGVMKSMATTKGVA